MNSPKDEIKNTWQIIATHASSILELRAIWPKGIDGKKPTITKHFRAEGYPDKNESKLNFENEALGLNEIGYNIYVVMNPIKTAFMGKNVGDDDISYRDLILIDIDKVTPRDKPSTDNEVEAARQLADELSEYLSSNFSWPKPIRIMSGNGHHLYYPVLDLPNTDDSKQLTRNFLKQLKGKFNNNVVQIDTSVFNASRITKVVGTVARKGLETSERPYRMAYLYEC